MNASSSINDGDAKSGFVELGYVIGDDGCLATSACLFSSY